MLNYYKSKNLKIVPLHKKNELKNKTGKEALIKDFLNLSKEELYKSFDKLSNYGIGILTGKDNNLIVLDIDVDKSIPLENRINTFWSDYITIYKEPNTPKVKTPSGGLHYYFKYDDRFKNITSKINMLNSKIDLKVEKGYIVAPGTDGYTWINDLEIPMIEFPDDLYNKLYFEISNKQDSKVQKKFKYNTNIDINDNIFLLQSLDIDKINKALNIIVKSVDEYKIWIKVGMILKNELKDHGFDIWNEWSKRGNKYDERKIYMDWIHLKYDGTLKIGTLYFLARIINEEEYDKQFNNNINLLFQGYLGYRTIVLKYFKNKLIIGKDKTIIYIWNDKIKLYDEKESDEFSTTIYNCILAHLLYGISEYDKLKLEIVDKAKVDELNELSQLLKRKTYLLTELKCSAFIISIRNEFKDLDKFEKLNNPVRHELPIKNGKVIDLKTGNIRDRTIEDYYSFELKVEYNDSTESNNVQIDFINEIMDYRIEYINLLQKILGYCLTGEIYAQKLFIFYGNGANGKSTLMSIFNKMFGDYYTIVTRSLLIKDKHELARATPEIESIRSKRLGVLEETSNDDTLNDNRIKNITGNDKIRYRPLYSKELTMDNYCKFIICTNNKPDITKYLHDGGLERRIEYIPFDMKFVLKPKFGTNERQLKDINIDQTFINNFFKWCVQGSINFYKYGFDDTLLNNLKQENILEFDTIQQFINECIISKIGSKIQATLLYDSYKKWFIKTHSDSDIIKQKEFGVIMSNKNYKKIKNSVMYYMDIDFKDYLINSNDS